MDKPSIVIPPGVLGRPTGKPPIVVPPGFMGRQIQPAPPPPEYKDVVREAIANQMYNALDTNCGMEAFRRMRDKLVAEQTFFLWVAAVRRAIETLPQGFFEEGNMIGAANNFMLATNSRGFQRKRNAVAHELATLLQLMTHYNEHMPNEYSHIVSTGIALGHYIFQKISPKDLDIMMRRSFHRQQSED